MNSFRSNLVDFPTFTLCPEYRAAFKDSILEKYNTSSNEMRGMKFPNNISKTTFELYMESTFDLDEVLKDMRIVTNGAESGYTKFFIQNITDVEKLPKDGLVFDFTEVEWKTQYYFTFGRCFSYTIPDSIKTQRVNK